MRRTVSAGGGLRAEQASDILGGCENCRVGGEQHLLDADRAAAQVEFEGLQSH